LLNGAVNPPHRGVNLAHGVSSLPAFSGRDC